MKERTLREHRARIQNINLAQSDAPEYTARIRIRDYLAGQCIYSLGDYPAKFSIEPTDYDEKLIRDMAEHGVSLIQVHEEWNDSIRYLGADKFSSHDHAGMIHFVELCHRYGIKIIPYISSGYFHEYDPDFRESFGRAGAEPHWCIGMHFKYRCCSPGSAEWREYLLPRTFQALETYGFDGIYNDWGYDWSPVRTEYLKLRQEGWGTGALYEPEIEDLLGLIYHEVHHRGGVYKLHADGNNSPPCKDKIYDYLWIGEGIGEEAVGIGKNYQPYVVPCYDFRAKAPTLREFAATIPFCQFPLLKYGRPLLGNNTHEPIPYYGDQSPRSEFGFNRRVEEYMKAHPDGPYVYSLWSSIPDDPMEYSRWCDYLSYYLPMVEEDSLVFTELRNSPLVRESIPQEVIMSLFVNEKYYLAVSNFTGAPYTLHLRDNWRDRRTGNVQNRFIIANEDILFLEKPEMED